MSNRHRSPDHEQRPARLRELLAPADPSAENGRISLGRLTDGVLRLFDDPDRQPDYEARRDRMCGRLLSCRARGRADQSSSSVSQ